MEEMGIDRLGIVKLLTQLKDHKACGPDLLPTKILKEAAEPVSVTCVCSKLMEHIIVSNVMNHFTNHNVLFDRQHGFRARRSCESQLISLTQELHEHLEKKSQIDLIVLDFSKAFYKVPHQRLMGKIWNQGIQGTTHHIGDKSALIKRDGSSSSCGERHSERHVSDMWSLLPSDRGAHLACHCDSVIERWQHVCATTEPCVATAKQR